MKHIIKFLLIIFFLAFINTVFSQTTDEQKLTNYEKSSLFNNKEPISIDLFVNKKELFRDIEENPEYHRAIIKYIDENQEQKEFGFKISTRGHFRKDPQNCNLPPLKLKIPKEVSQSDNLFAGQNKIKLVVPCKPGSEKYQECLIMEYLVYKTYEVFTEKSFRTRLVNVTLNDSNNQKQKIAFIGFFLEEIDQLAARNNGKILNFKRYHPENVNRQQMTMLSVFEYMVGNTDWSVDVSHNIELFFMEDQTSAIAIPFDFDWSGIVDSPYAIPSEVLKIPSVRHRLFRGYERSMEEYEPIIKLFNEKKQDIYNLYNNCLWLSEKTKINTLKYLDEFYETINDPKKVEKEFIKNSRKI